MVKWQLLNADIIDVTDIVTSRLFWKSFNCRYNPRTDYAFCLLTLESSEQWRSHYLVLHATSMTKFYLTVCYFQHSLTHMSFIYCHLNFHTNLLRPGCFPLNSLRPKNYKQLNFRSISIYLRKKDFRVQITNIFLYKGTRR